MTRELLLKLLRFGVAGGLVTVLFMALNWWFGRWLSTDLAYFAAYPIAVGFHFCLSKWWTFADRTSVRTRQFTEYLAMMVLAFAIQTAVFKGLTHYWAVPGWLASGVAAIVQMAFSFLMMQCRIFARTADLSE